MTILVAVFFDAILIRLFMIDVNDIMEDNSKCGEIITVIDREKELFDQYVNSTTSENEDAFKLAMKQTKTAVYAIPLDYSRLGENRYAQLYSLQSCYEVYCGYRDEVNVIVFNDSFMHEECVSDLLTIDQKGCVHGTYKIRKGDRIAQMVVAKVEYCNFIETDNVKAIGEDRGGGFGSSGVN